MRARFTIPSPLPLPPSDLPVSPTGATVRDRDGSALGRVIYASITDNGLEIETDLTVEGAVAIGGAGIEAFSIADPNPTAATAAPDGDGWEGFAVTKRAEPPKLVPVDSPRPPIQSGSLAERAAAADPNTGQLIE